MVTPAGVLRIVPLRRMPDGETIDVGPESNSLHNSAKLRSGAELPYLVSSQCSAQRFACAAFFSKPHHPFVGQTLPVRQRHLQISMPGCTLRAFSTAA